VGDVLRQPMARLNDHRKKHMGERERSYRERLDTFHKFLPGITLEERIGRPWVGGAIARAGCY
jgi:hypothetical protein